MHDFDIIVEPETTIREILYMVADWKTRLGMFNNRKEVKESMLNTEYVIDLCPLTNFDEPILESWWHILKIMSKKRKCIMIWVNYHKNNMPTKERIKYWISQFFSFWFDKEIMCLYIPLSIYPRSIKWILNKEFWYIEENRKEICIKSPMLIKIFKNVLQLGKK